MKKIYFLVLALCFFSGLTAQVVTFQDFNLKMKLLSSPVNMNFNSEIEISEALNATYLDISNSNITSLQGLESFANLEYLNCSNNPLLNNIDFNQLKKLSYLNYSFIQSITYLNFENTNISILVLEGLTNLNTIYCTGNKNLTSLNLNGAMNLVEAWVSHNNLTSLNLSGLASITKLACQVNQLATLDVNDLISLKSLECGGNLLTSLNVSKLTNLTNLELSYNKLQRLDAGNLSKLIELNASFNELLELKVNGLVNLKDLNFDSNKIFSINLEDLTNLKNLYGSGNELKTLDVTKSTKVIDLRCSYNQLSFLDLKGLTSILNLECFHNQFTTLDLSDLKSIERLRCDQNQLTSLFIRNGSNEAKYLNFSQNPGLKYICVDESQIEQVKELVVNYGYDNCNINSYCSFNPAGTYYTVQGTNKFDGNNNGCDGFDTGFPNLKFNIFDGTNTGSEITNANGNYSISLPEGTHTLTPVLENPAYFSISPSTLNVSFPSQASPLVEDFCITANGVHSDLEVVVLQTVPARPGFEASYKVIYKNKGNNLQSGAITLIFNDLVLDFLTSNPAVSVQETNTLSWNFINLKPFESREIAFRVKVNTPTSIPAVNNGDILSYTANILSSNTDETPNDNIFAFNQIVVGSYDPNDKTCLEGTVITPSLIGEYVHYMIRFENTGSYSAQNIVVKDMIDLSKFDVSTLILTSSSHSFVTKISEGNKVEFIFENVNLPFDDANNDGYIAFKIKTKPTLAIGDSFTNDASIYFDYNFPIVTNKATSTFKTLNAFDFEFSNYVSLYPNPTNSILNISARNTIEVQSIAVYDILGRLMIAIPNAKNTTAVDVSNLKSGNYFIKINSDKGTSNTKFVKN